ncbi:Detected protein of unknown function [Hibiscus syriacus]|uniref:RING-type E3 ubiquitin transferase n=1 Tax=Hibiscus syriacus TaxID=106335 RepID=A0A6A2YVC7_HIBSY|nr:E3 ubiquitin-protein ligase SIRP1-like [Hibiscus syriacus]KAE8683366.1 Detected protein of unknown function [Hibiscus syriacus]
MESSQTKSLSSSSSSVFEIEVRATFIIVERNPVAGGEPFVEAGRIISQVIHEFPFDDLINDGNGAVSDMLDSMRFPVEPSMVEEIAATAVRLATDARDRDGKVLRMEVAVEAVVDDVPDFGSDDKDDSDGEGVTMTAEEVAENVGKTVVDAAGKECPICLEELVVGGEAVCVPCSHSFHELCIVTWLKKKKRCPCCRFDMSKVKSKV